MQRFPIWANRCHQLQIFDAPLPMVQRVRFKRRCRMKQHGSFSFKESRCYHWPTNVAHVRRRDFYLSTGAPCLVPVRHPARECVPPGCVIRINLDIRMRTVRIGIQFEIHVGNSATQCDLQQGRQRHEVVRTQRRFKSKFGFFRFQFAEQMSLVGLHTRILAWPH